MKKLLLALIVLFPLGASAQLNTFQGGTGTTSPSGILYGDSTIRLKTVGIGTGLQFSGGTLSATGVAGDWATTSEAYYWSQFRDFHLTGSPLYLTSTTSRSFLINNSTSTITNLTTLTATTTNLIISSLSSELLKVNANGNVEEAISGTDYEVPLTFGDGLTRTSNDIDVDTTQNILKLSNLTSNGFVKTSGGDGTLSIDTTTYESGLTAGDGLTRTANDFDCDTANGSTFGCLTSADWTTFNNKQVQVTGTYPITVTGLSANMIGLAFGTTTNNTWSGTNTFTGDVTMTNATSTNLGITSLTSALVKVDANGSTGEYAGTSCTNQFVRSLSALGVATCETVANTDLANSTISGVALGQNLANLSATDATLTFSGTYNGGTARTIGLNLGNANTWTATQTFGDSITTGSLAVPNNGTVNAGGEITVDDTSGQLRYYAGSAERVVVPYTTIAFGYATSTAWTGTTTLYLAPAIAAGTLIGGYCETDAGTTGVSIYDGTNRATYIPTASTTKNLFTFSANNTFTAGESIRADIGTPASSPTKLSCRFRYTITAD